MKDDLPGLVVRIDGKKVTRKELETFIKNNREEFCNAFNAEIALAMRERDIRNKNYGYGEKEIEEIEKAFARDVKKPVEEKTVEHPNIENENFYNQEVREEDQLMIRSLREQYLGHDLWVREGQIKSNGRAADQDGLGLRLAERNKEIKGKPYFIVTHHYLSNTGKKKTIAYRVQVSSHERENKGKKETSWELFVNGTRITYDPNKTTDFGNRDNTVGFLRTVVGVDPDQFEQKFETMVEELPHIQEKLEETEPFKAFLDSNEKELSVPFEEEDGTSHTLSIYKIKEENGEEQLAYKLDHVEIDEANKADFYSAIIAAGGIQEGSRFLEEMQKAIKLREQVRVRMKLLEKYEKKTGLPLKELDKKDELDTVMREALSLKKREEVEDMLVWFNTERISSVEQLVDNLHTYHTAFQKNNVYEINGQKLEVLAEYDEEDFKELGQWMKKNGARLAKGILKAGSRDFIHEAKSLVRRAPHGFARVMKIIVPQVAVVMDGKQVPMR
ncbi:MAG: hypothetical protein Q4B26_00360 [Eubacteriales bacterium]|nr:hypothetical protein [Eubacteriales bacterium]